MALTHMMSEADEESERGEHGHHHVGDDLRPRPAHQRHEQHQADVEGLEEHDGGDQQPHLVEDAVHTRLGCNINNLLTLGVHFDIRGVGIDLY